MASWLVAIFLASTVLAQNATTYFSAPGFTTIPFNISTPYVDLQTEVSDNAFFLTCIRGLDVQKPRPAIFDVQGNLIWMSPDLGECLDLNQQTYNGESVLTVWVGEIQGAGWGIGQGVIMDSSYSVIKNITTKPGVDMHEFNIPSRTNNTAIVTVYNPIPADLTPFGGPSDGWVLDNLVQEIDIATGNILFNWSSVEHLSLNDSFAAPGTSGTAQNNSWDAIHLNSVDVDGDGNYLVSSRHLHQLYNVDKNTGDIIWRLGGKTNDFQMGNGSTFLWQHHARWHENFTHVSIFDNGASNWESDEPSARGIYVALDTSAKTATLEREYLPIQRNTSQSQGSVQMLDNGNVLVSYGSSPWVTEYTVDGSIVFSMSIKPSSLRDVENYRTFKTTTWVGRPSIPPTIAAINSSSGLDVYVSWNGATHVSAYTLLAGGNVSSLAGVSNTSRNAFETHISMSEPQDFVAVAALANNGTELGRTPIIRINDGTIVQNGSVATPTAVAPPSGGNTKDNGAANLRYGMLMSVVVGTATLLSMLSV